MKTRLHRLARGLYIAAALAIGLVAFVPALEQTVFAGGQVSTRSIQMSTSNVSATAQYLVTFTPATTGAQSLVVDFCKESPIISATCTTPTGFSASSATFTAGTGTTNWSLTASAGTVKLTKNTGSALSTSAASFTVNSITNPDGTDCAGGNNNCTFYARIYTYDCTDYGAHVGGGACSTTGTAYSSPTAPGSYIDYGGFALSTAHIITITATVQETLTFCTSGLVAGSAPTDCSAPTTPAVTLGSGTPLTIDANTIYDNSAGTYRTYMGLSTNAINGASVTMKSNWTCNGLSSNGGSTCGIPGSSGALSAGTAGFGMKVATGTGTTGSLTAANSYSAATFHMGSTGSATTYGDQIASTGSAPCTMAISQLTFGATASPTTAAGVYTTNETLIATGTF